ncbi:MAG: DNA methyltransferase [Desulfomonilaceae bacterium]
MNRLARLCPGPSSLRYGPEYEAGREPVEACKACREIVRNDRRDPFIFTEDRVLDPFCGSGTTCLTAAQLTRQYVGIDNSSDYCHLARSRISAFTSLTSPKAFDIPACNQ